MLKYISGVPQEHPRSAPGALQEHPRSIPGAPGERLGYVIQSGFFDTLYINIINIFFILIINQLDVS